MAMAISSSSYTNIFSNFLQIHSNISLSQKTHISYHFNCPTICIKTQENRKKGKFITSMGTYNVQVVVDENEGEERLINRFRREVFRAGVIQECKRRRWHENSQDKRKRKSREAAKRNRKRRPQARLPKQTNVEAPKKDLDDFEDDNWELPEGDLPY